MPPGDTKPLRAWAVLVVAVYGLTLAAWTPPLGRFLLGKSAESWDEVLRAWGFWAWCGSLVLGQAVLLLVPVRAMGGRPVTRRRLVPAIVAGSFFLAVLLGFAVLSVAAAFGGDKGLDVGIIAALVFVVATWIAWAIVFWRLSARQEPMALLPAMTRWLLRGSALELLVAVPSHVIVRRRDDCCAPVATFWGIATGLAVMLLAFGPAVVLLYARRVRGLQPKSSPGAA